VCGHKINDDYVGPVSHNYVWSVTKNPTCSTFGEETGVCSYCGKKTTKTIIPAHDWSETKFDYEPTCTTQGRTYVECLVCGLKTSYKYVSATGHNYSEWVQIGEATCQEYGKFEHYCLICGETGFMSAKGEHDYSVETIIVEPTCTTVGSKTIECSLCGDTYNEEIPITGHSHNATITEPTCTEQGYTTYTCECGNTYVDDYIDALGHTEETLPAVAPTCNEIGLAEGTQCSVCGEILTEQETISATGHADNDGDGYCDNCDEQLCNHRCHKTGFIGFLWKIINFFNKLFGLNKICECGVAHY